MECDNAATCNKHKRGTSTDFRRDRGTQGRAEKAWGGAAPGDAPVPPAPAPSKRRRAAVGGRHRPAASLGKCKGCVPPWAGRRRGERRLRAAILTRGRCATARPARQCPALADHKQWPLQSTRKTAGVGSEQSLLQCVSLSLSAQLV